MSFLDELRQRNSTNPTMGPTGMWNPNQQADQSSGGGVSTPIFGPGPQDEQMPDLLTMRKRAMDMSLDDFKARAQFANDLPLRQQNVQRIYDQQKPQNVVMGGVIQDPNQADTRYEDQLDLEKQKVAATVASSKNKNDLLNKDYELKQGQLALAQKKEADIKDTKTQDLQRKVDDANNKLGLSYEQLANKQNDAAAHADFLKAQREAADARHVLDLHQKDLTLEETKRQHDMQMKALQDKLDLAAKPTKQTTEMNAAKDKKTVITAKGDVSSGKRVAVITPDGKSGTVSEEESKSLPSGWKLK